MRGGIVHRLWSGGHPSLAKKREQQSQQRHVESHPAGKFIGEEVLACSRQLASGVGALLSAHLADLADTVSMHGNIVQWLQVELEGLKQRVAAFGGWAANVHDVETKLQCMLRIQDSIPQNIQLRLEGSLLLDDKFKHFVDMVDELGVRVGDIERKQEAEFTEGNKGWAGPMACCGERGLDARGGGPASSEEGDMAAQLKGMESHIQRLFALLACTEQRSKWAEEVQVPHLDQDEAYRQGQQGGDLRQDASGDDEQYNDVRDLGGCLFPGADGNGDDGESQSPRMRRFRRRSKVNHK